MDFRRFEMTKGFKENQVQDLLINNQHLTGLERVQMFLSLTPPMTFYCAQYSWVQTRRALSVVAFTQRQGVLGSGQESLLLWGYLLIGGLARRSHRKSQNLPFLAYPCDLSVTPRHKRRQQGPDPERSV